MIILVAAVLGGLFGAFQARKRKGKALDMVQYAIGYGIAFAILALFVNIVLLRNLDV